MREARLSEIKRELLNSKKLASYFEDNPRERDLLKHDKVHIATAQYNVFLSWLCCVRCCGQPRYSAHSPSPLCI